MITIPTTELIGCISAVLPITLDPKDPLAGVAIQWDGEILHFTAYDVTNGATVRWIPGEGAEGEVTEAAPVADEPEWGSDDDPWHIFVRYDDAKEIVKLFKLPAKLWRYPVNLKVNLSQSKLIVERNDMSRGERLLTVSTDNTALRNIPDVRSIAEDAATSGASDSAIATFNGLRLGALSASTAYGTLTLAFGTEDRPVGAFAGTRYVAFIYRADAKNVRPFNLLRDGAGLVTS